MSQSEIQAIYNAGSSGKCFVPVAPAITTQPASQVANVGSSVTFNVAASGTQPLSYQWRCNGANLTGKTTNSLTLASVQLTDAGTYTVVVTNLAGSAISSNAVLTVNSAPPVCVTPPPGLISWWRAESNAWDSVGANNALPSSGVSYAPGRVGQAFAFNGSSGYVRVPYSPSLLLTNALTLEAWVQTTRSADQDIISKWDTIGGPAQKCFATALDPLGRSTWR